MKYYIDTLLFFEEYMKQIFYKVQNHRTNIFVLNISERFEFHRNVCMVNHYIKRDGISHQNRMDHWIQNVTVNQLTHA